MPYEIMNVQNLLIMRIKASRLMKFHKGGGFYGGLKEGAGVFKLTWFLDNIRMKFHSTFPNGTL